MPRTPEHTPSKQQTFLDQLSQALILKLHLEKAYFLTLNTRMLLKKSSTWNPNIRKLLKKN